MPSRRLAFASLFRSTSAKMAAAFVLCSAASYLLESNDVVTLRLVPASVITDLTLWQLVTFIPITYQGLGLLFGTLILWQMGGFLEAVWGSRRVFQVPVALVLLSGLLTVVASLFVRSLRVVPQEGGWALVLVIWVLYGLQVGRGQTNFWGIPVTGNALAMIGAGLVLLGAVFGRWESSVPSALALGLTWGYARLGGPRQVRRLVQSWWQELLMKRRSRRLRMISGERNMPRDSDRYLH